MKLETKKIITCVLFLLVCTKTSEGSSLCDFSGGGMPEFDTVAYTLAGIIVGEIPAIGPFAEAFVAVTGIIADQGYSQDITNCVETLIEQQLDARVVNSTNIFLEYWNTTISVWREAPLASNTSDTQSTMVTHIWDETFNGALEYLPEVKYKEQVMVQWLDIVSTEVFVFEATAVNYTAQFGKGSKESCYQWNLAETYTSSLIDHIDKQMINGQGSCLNTSTFKRADDICLCQQCIAWFIEVDCHYWIADLYNSSCTARDRPQCDFEEITDWDCNVCDRGDNVDNWPGSCKTEAENYNHAIDEYLDHLITYLTNTMNWLNNRKKVMQDQLNTWCK